MTRGKTAAFGLGLCVLVGFMLFTVVPLTRYRPNCGSIETPIYLDGPLRPDYRDNLEHVLNEEGFYYWKLNGNIYLKTMDVVTGLDFYHELFRNAEADIISNLSHGYRANGERIPPPPPLLDAIRRTEAEYGPFPAAIVGSDSRHFRDCDVMRAGAIWVEKLDG